MPRLMGKGFFFPWRWEGGLNLPHDLEHRFVNIPVRCKGFQGRIDAVRASVEIRQLPTGLLHEKAACSHVPRMKLHLPEAVESTCCDIAEIEDGRARAAKGKGPHHEGAEKGEVEIGVSTDVVGKPRSDEARIEILVSGGPNTLPVEKGSVSFDGMEKLSKVGVVNHGERKLPFVFQSDRHAKTRVSMDVIGRPVKRVHDPAPRRTFPFKRGLLCQDLVIGESVADSPEDSLLADAVHLCHRIDFGFVLHMERMLKGAPLDPSCIFGRINGHFQIRFIIFHGGLRRTSKIDNRFTKTI